MNYLDFIKPLYKIEAFQGCTEEEITAMKSRFGAIPKAVEDFYRAAAKTDALHHVQDTWILPEHYGKWSWLSKTGALILLSENQGVCFAGILPEDLDKPDPPVYVTYDHETFQTWELCAPSATEFFAAALGYEAAFTFEYEPQAFYWYTQPEVERVEAGLEKLPWELLDWCSEMHITLYQNASDNLLALMSFEGGEGEKGCEPQALYGAASEEGYQKLLTVVDGLGEEV